MNDVWLLKGVAGGGWQPHWQQLEVFGEAPSPRKAQAMAGLFLALMFDRPHPASPGLAVVPSLIPTPSAGFINTHIHAWQARFDRRPPLYH